MGRKGISRISIKTRVVMIMGRAVKGAWVNGIKVNLCNVITAGNMDIWHVNVRILPCHIITDSNF